HCVSWQFRNILVLLLRHTATACRADVEQYLPGAQKLSEFVKPFLCRKIGLLKKIFQEIDSF
ncbi:MAG: hypothetical protein SOZ13_04360, partial [Enterococcus avium]|nr:hypothetical protein [Enterococcus avium]